MPRQTRNSLLGRDSPAPEPTTTVSSLVPSVHSSTQAVATDEAPEDNICHICKEEFHTGPEPEAPVTLPCGHRFGLSCLHQWTQVPERNHACPLCNRHLYPAAVRQRQLLAHAPPPQRSIEELLQNAGEVLIVRNPVADEALPGNNDVFVVTNQDGNSAIMTRAWFVGEVRRLGLHELAARIDNTIRSGRILRSPFGRSVESWGYAILAWLVDALDLYAWRRAFTRGSLRFDVLTLCLLLFLRMFFKRNGFMQWLDYPLFGLWILLYLFV